MNVFPFYQANLLTLASIKAKLPVLITSKIPLKILSKVSYPFSFSPIRQIIKVGITTPNNIIININPTNKIKIISFSEGFGFFTHSFNKSPKYVKTSTNKIPNPLLISLSSSYLSLPILKMTTYGGNK